MRVRTLLFMFMAGLALHAAKPAPESRLLTGAEKRSAIEAYRRLPIHFENVGTAEARFAARAAEYRLSLDERGARFSFWGQSERAPVGLRFVNPAPAISMRGL